MSFERRRISLDERRNSREERFGTKKSELDERRRSSDIRDDRNNRHESNRTNSSSSRSKDKPSSNSKKRPNDSKDSPRKKRIKKEDSQLSKTQEIKKTPKDSPKPMEEEEPGEIRNGRDEYHSLTPKRSNRWEDDEEPKKKEKDEVPAETPQPSVNLISPEAKPDTQEQVIKPTEEIKETPIEKPTKLNREETLPIELPKEESSIGRLFQGLLSCRSVDNFIPVCRIGDGAYGVVYKARDKKSTKQEYVALKKVKMEKEKEGFPLTSIREIRILMSCKHENIVGVKEIVVGKQIDSIFIVMEYLEHDLKTLMEDMPHPFTVSEVKCIISQLLHGVEYLHKNWILHRDIKTSNLLLNNRGIMKIADFGLARPYGSPLQPYTHVVVTLWYRSPELLLGTQVYTPAIDMWSVGCVFAELLHNKAVFRMP